MATPGAPKPKVHGVVPSASATSKATGPADQAGATSMSVGSAAAPVTGEEGLDLGLNPPKAVEPAFQSRIQATGDFEGLAGRALERAIYPGAIFRLKENTRIDGVVVPAGAVGRVVRYYGLRDSLDVAFDVEDNPALRKIGIIGGEGGAHHLSLDSNKMVDPAKFEWLAKALPAKDSVKVVFTLDNEDRRVLAGLMKVSRVADEFMAEKGRKSLEGLCECIEEKTGVQTRPRDFKDFDRSTVWAVSLRDLGVDLKIGRKDPANLVQAINKEVQRREQLMNQAGSREFDGYELVVAHKVGQITETVLDKHQGTHPEVGLNVFNELFRLTVDGNQSLHAYPGEAQVVDPEVFLAQVPGALERLDQVEAALEVYFKRAKDSLGSARDLIDSLARQAEQEKVATGML